MTLAKNQFPEKVKKTRDDFVDLKEASLEILAEYGGKCNHDEVLGAIRKDQANKAVDLLIEVATAMNELLKTVNQQGLDRVEVAKAKELISRVNRFLDEAVDSCDKTFGSASFQETDFLKEIRYILSSKTLFQKNEK